MPLGPGSEGADSPTVWVWVDKKVASRAHALNSVTTPPSEHSVQSQVTSWSSRQKRERSPDGAPSRGHKNHGHRPENSRAPPAPGQERTKHRPDHRHRAPQQHTRGKCGGDTDTLGTWPSRTERKGTRLGVGSPQIFWLEGGDGLGRGEVLSGSWEMWEWGF